MRASKLRLPDSTAAQTRSFVDDRLVDLGRAGAGVADARRAAVGRDVEAELLEVGQEPGLGQVLGDHARARRERGLDVRLDREAVLDRLLREQARGEHHARVRRVGAGGDRGDQHVAVADVDRSSSLRDRVGVGRLATISTTSRGAPFGGFRASARARCGLVGIGRNACELVGGCAKPFSATGLLKSSVNLRFSCRARCGPAGASVRRATA